MQPFSHLPLRERLSRERLEGFRTTAHEQVGDVDLLGRYIESMAIAETLFPALHLCEVILRNRIFDAGRRLYPVHSGTRQTYGTFPCWLDAYPELLHEKEAARVDTAIADLTERISKRLKCAQSAVPGRELRPGRLVAELSFGFWVNLCSSRYHSSPKHVGLLWPHQFASVFPGLKKGTQLHAIDTALHSVLRLRNRAMHHERLSGRATSVAQERATLMTVLEWLDPNVAATVSRLDRFDAVTSGRFAVWAKRMAGALLR